MQHADDRGPAERHERAVVLAADAGAAIAEAKRDMLAECIAAVEDWFGPKDNELRWLLDGEAVLAALRALQEKP